MGKYSLENFERYKTVKCRPEELPGPIENRGAGRYEIISMRWNETETARGEYRLIGDAAGKPQNPGNRGRLLELWLEPPGWAASDTDASGREAALAASWIRRMGAALDGGGGFTGVLMRLPRLGGAGLSRLGGAGLSRLGGAARRELLDALFQGFDRAWPILPLEAEADIAYAKERGIRFGLLAECGEEPYACCEMFARLRLQQVWKTAPVFAERGEGCDAALFEKLAYQWHAAASRPDIGLGFRLALRRLTYPAALTSGGAMPLRFWWSNDGSSPCCEKTAVRLRLEGEAGSFPFSPQDEPALWPVGDRSFNRIVRLPQAPPGEYRLTCGVFFEDGAPLRLAMPGGENGFYEIGRVMLDEIARPELFHAWDDYYPEGYYPLVDPPVPG